MSHDQKKSSYSGFFAFVALLLIGYATTLKTKIETAHNPTPHKAAERWC
jgi:Flp pilus assembly pilin Flp